MEIKVNIKKIEDELNKIHKNLNINYKGVKAGYFVGKNYPNGFSIAKNALTQNYGNERIPARPFLTNTYDKHKEQWKKLFIKNFTNKRTMLQNLNIVGEYMKNNIKQSIDETLTPPNSPQTIRRKKSSHPLIDTGLLKKSVAKEVIHGNK